MLYIFIFENVSDYRIGVNIQNHNTQWNAKNAHNNRYQWGER